MPTYKSSAIRCASPPAAGTETIAHHNDPLAVLKALLARYRAADLPELPRFWGGLVGYFTYEMVSFFESRVPNRCRPNQPLAHFMLPEELLIFDNIRNTLLCLAVAFIDGPKQAGACLCRRRQPAQPTAAAPSPPRPPRSDQSFGL
jgi:anthranilate/para-aminobenzoate synthase component I